MLHRVLRIGVVVTVVFLLVCSISSCDSNNRLLSANRVSEFHSAWPKGVERVWTGPEYYANRLLDWRVRDGRLECIEGRKVKPMRTIHLLTRSLGEKPGVLEITVRTGPIEPGGKKHEDTWSGFLLGVGGEHVDFRISALCHHWPSTDGGLIAAVDGTGRAIFRDNSRHFKIGTGKPYPLEAWSMLEPVTTEGGGFGEKVPDEIYLHLKAEPSKSGYKLTLSVYDGSSDELISRTTVDGVNRQQLSGNVALVSHQSPKQEGQGYWFADWKVSGTKVEVHPERAFGPVMAAQHTISKGTLKMTAQMGPLGKKDSQTAQLQIRRSDNGIWRTVATGKLIEHSYTIPLRVEGWDSTKDFQYRIVYELCTGPDSTKPYYYYGTIRKEPVDYDTFVVAAFTGHHISARGVGHWNHNSVWYPHNELVAAVKYHKPDFLFFSGDQIYEGGLAGIVREPAEVAALDYLYHWYRWCWAFRDLARDIPCICIPDDHDVYHGNLWGAGGRHAKEQDDGGYRMSPLFVNAVQHTQSSHLPDPVDPTPVEQGIEVYYTNMEYAGLSFAIIEDRKWKSSPTVMVPEGNCVNGWFLKPDFDPAKQADVPGAVLLGERQLEFLNCWADDWSGGVWMKVLLSQTIFANVATLPKEANNDSVVPRMRYPKKGEYIKNDKFVADGDSNAWPQSGRNKALRAVRRAFALHIAGDQHLGSTIQYGVDGWDDAGYALCVPSTANAWPRRWFPPEPGLNHKPGEPAYTGQYKDGFGNHITVHAVSNPYRTGHEPSALYDRGPGYGIVRFKRKSRQIIIENWPRWVAPSKFGAKPYPGWPVVINQTDNYGRKAAAYLPTVKVNGMTEPVVQIVDEANGEVVYTLRIKGRTIRPKVFKDRIYTVKVGEPGTARMKILKGIQPVTAKCDSILEVNF